MTPSMDVSRTPIQEVRVETRRTPEGKIEWRIWVDGEDHGGGNSEPSHEAALMFAGYYTRDRSDR